MISIKVAQQIVVDHCLIGKNQIIPATEACGRVLAENVIAPIDHPIFDQTGVDGYAFCHPTIHSGSLLLEVQDILPAGASPLVLAENKAIRIFTGAPVPVGADTVIMQEYVSVQDGKISFNLDDVQKGANIRRRGEQLDAGSIALEKGLKLKPSAIGLLASLGISSVEVKIPLTTGIIATGNEFVQPGESLQPGQIFESNTDMLKSLLAQNNISAQHTVSQDDPNILRAKLEFMEKSCDLTIITGGVSVGDFDYTRHVIEEAGYKVQFHGVAQKPGKPLLFATKNGKAIFGLPGNPRAVLVAFYEYVLPYIHASQGMNSPFLTKVYMPFKGSFKGTKNRSEFISACFDGAFVTFLPNQLSHMLQSFTNADAIVVLPENSGPVTDGQMIEVHLLPA